MITKSHKAPHEFDIQCCKTLEHLIVSCIGMLMSQRMRASRDNLPAALEIGQVRIAYFDYEKLDELIVATTLPKRD